MKKLLILLFLTSCATTQNQCVHTSTETFMGTKYVEFQCDGYKKYCKYDSDDRKINCFTTKR